ncbi:MAG: hypothetical protein ACOYOT_11645 [Bacteroidales bacterium]
MKKTLLILIFIAAGFEFLSAQTYTKRQEWQWQTSISTTDNKGSVYNLTPYMWIPPSCQKVTAVLVSSTAVLEQAMVEDPNVRAVCAKRGIAILWSSDNFYHDDVTATGQIQSMLQAFSTLTGYSELKTVPWIVTGHSGTNPMPRYIVKNSPANVAFAIIHKATAQCGSITTVPILSTNGEFMEWDSYSKDLTANITTESSYGDVRNQRNTYAQPLSYFFDPNTGHFDCSRPLLKNIAMWMDDVFGLRFDAQGNMIPLDQSKGWIVGLPCAGYKGDAFAPIPYTNVATATLTLAQVKAAAWFPSQRTAQAAYDMANVSMTRKHQVTGFADVSGQYDAQTYWWRAIMYKIPFTLNADGHSVTLNTVPYYRMPNRTDYNDNSFNMTQSFFNKADNSFTNSGNPSQIEVCSGNWIQTAANTFEYVPRFKSTNYFIVRQQGDDAYRSSVQAGNVNLTAISTGTANTITFPTIPNQTISSLSPITLGATSSAGVAVRYFVNSGAAHISNGQLIVDKDSIPSRARFPMPITVTAYHLGTASPLVNTASAVTKTFYLTNGTSTALTWYVSPSGNGDGTSWNTPCTLATALNMATYGDNIFMKTGDYVLSSSLTIDSKVVNIYGGFAGTESSAAERMREDLDQNGITEPWEFKNPTRIVGGRYKATPASFTVLKVTGASASDVKIDGVVVDEGLFLGNGSPAAVSLAGKCLFTNSIVRNSRVYNSTGEVNANAPGGICATVADALIDGCLIENCEAQASQINGTRAGQCRGGGVYLSGGVLQNSIIRNNRIIYNMNRAPENTYTVYYNPYLFGAGVYSTLRTSKVANCVIANNEARVINWNTTTQPSASTVVIRGGGFANENGGVIINNTIVNNRAVVNDLSGNVVTNAGSAGQGAGLFIQNGSTATSYDNYVVNNVFWGNSAPGTSSAYQSVRLTVNTTASITPQQLVQYSNNITTEAISISATTAPFYAESNKFIDLAASNSALSKAPQFKTPSAFAGAIWGTSADSLKSITMSNWSIASSSYCIAKGTKNFSAPATDISGATRDAASPTVGAYEALIYTTPTALNSLQKSKQVYRSGNRIFNLNFGDKIAVYDVSGRCLESIVATSNIATFTSKGFVIISIRQLSGNQFCIK